MINENEVRLVAERILQLVRRVATNKVAEELALHTKIAQQTGEGFEQTARWTMGFNAAIKACNVKLEDLPQHELANLAGIRPTEFSRPQ